MTSINKIRAKWDALAAPQLREELERMQIALEEAQARAEDAESKAGYFMELTDSYRDDCLQLMEESGKQLGLTKDGHLVAV